MSLTARKVNYIFKPLNLNIIVEKLFSGVVNSLRKDSQAEENRYLIWTTDRGEEQNTPRDTEYTLVIFLPAIAVMQVILISTLYLIAGINSKANQRASSYFL